MALERELRTHDKYMTLSRLKENIYYRLNKVAESAEGYVIILGKTYPATVPADRAKQKEHDLVLSCQEFFDLIWNAEKYNEDPMLFMDDGFDVYIHQDLKKKRIFINGQPFWNKYDGLVFESLPSRAFEKDKGGFIDLVWLHKLNKQS